MNAIKLYNFELTEKNWIEIVRLLTSIFLFDNRSLIISTFSFKIAGYNAIISNDNKIL